MELNPIGVMKRIDGWLRTLPPHTDFFAVILVIAIGAAIFQTNAAVEWTILPLLLAILSLYLYWKTRTDSFLRCFPYVAIIYLITMAGYLVAKYPIHDSFYYYFRVFQYIAESFAAGENYPAWFPYTGGVRIGFSHINYGYALPYHLFGYVLYAATPFSILFAYKLSCVVGTLLIGLGWGLFLERLTKSALASVVGTLAVMLGGSCITLHQEQVLVTLTYYPWLLLAFYELKNDRRWLLVIAALAGILVVTHYPQIHLVAIVLFILLVTATNPAAVRERLFLPSWKLLALSFIVFLMAASPLAYIVSHMNELASRHRPLFFPNDYETWLQINGPQGYASGRPWYFKQYLVGMFGRYNPFADSNGFFIGRVTVMLAAAGLIFQFRKSWPIAVLGVLYALLTMGIHSPIDLASLLFHTAKPLIGVMREWVHFFPLLNLSLIALAAYGVAYWCLRITPGRLDRPWTTWLTSAVFMVLVYDITDFSNQYIYAYTQKPPPSVVSGGFYLSKHDPSLVLYRSRMQLHGISSDTCCSDVIPSEPYLTSNVIPTVTAPDSQLNRLVTARRNLESGVVADIPMSMLPAAKSDALATGHDRVEQMLRYDGIHLNATTTRTALLVTAANYDLGWDATVDGESVPVWRVNGALAGMLIGPGKHRVTLRVRRDSYTYAFAAHLIVSLAAVVMIIYLLFRGHQSSATGRPRGS